LLPKEKLGFYMRLRSLAPLVSRRAGARHLTHAVLALWLEDKFPLLSRDALEHVQTFRKHPGVIKLARWLGQRDLFESAFWLSSAYAAWVRAEVRREQAMFFTPPELANRLIGNLAQNGADFTKHVFMDPACGGAAFLAPVAARMRSDLLKKGLGAKAILEHVRTQLIGADLDPTLWELSTIFLKMTLYEEIVAVGKEPEFNVREGNALNQSNALRGKVDVVLCNPPYRKMLAREVTRYRGQYGHVIEGQPNLYTLFFALSLDLLKPGGIAGLLTGTSYLSGQYFSKLRTFLLEKSHTRQIDVIGARTGVFVGAELNTAVTVLQKRDSSAGKSEKTRVFAICRANGFEAVGSYTLPNSGAAWPIPRSTEDAEAVTLANGSRFTLKDYGYAIRIGGFVWNRDKRNRFSTEAEAHKNTKAAFPLIWSSDIGQNGRVTFQSDHGQHAFVDMGTREHSYVIRRPCVVLQRVTSNDQPRRLVAAAIDAKLLKQYGGIVGENHVVVLERMDASASLTPREMARVLSSKPLDHLFRCISGAANVSAFELSQLPMPDPAALEKELRRTNDADTAVRRAFQAQHRH